MDRARELMDMVGLARRLENTYPPWVGQGPKAAYQDCRALASEPG